MSIKYPKRSFSTLVSRAYSTKRIDKNNNIGFLKPLVVKDTTTKYIVMDIETYQDNNGNHITYAVGIGFKYKDKMFY